MLAHVVLAATSLVAVPAAASADVSAPASDVVVDAAPDEPTPPTINEFIPEERSIGDCISALPKPGCGSDARGGWRQGLVLLAIVAALAFIGWRVVRASRRARTTAATPSPTGAITGEDGDRPRLEDR